MKAKIKVFFFYFFLLVMNLTFVNSIDVEISINESSSLTKLLNGQYSLVADGIIEVYNPSQVSTVFEFELPLELDALIGINKVTIADEIYTFSTFNNITNSTVNHTAIIPSGSGKFDFSFSRVRGYMLEPNETIKVGYHIFGLLDYDIYSNLVEDQTVFDYYVESYDFRANLVMNLQKAQREGFEYNIDGSLNKTPNPGNSSRLVSSEVRNPTDFNYFIKELRIYRTDAGNPFFDDGEIIETQKNVTVKPFELKIVDFMDDLSNGQSVYWLSADGVLNYNKFMSSSTNFNVQSSGGGSSNKKSGGGGSGFTSFDDVKLSSILVKKETDKTVIRNGEEFTVTVMVINVNDLVLEDLELIDEIPEGYEIKDISDSVKISDKTLKFNIDEVKEYETIVFTYTLIPKEKFKGVTYLKPARLKYDDEVYFSEGVLLINDLLPDEKIFVQKEVKYVDEDYAKVVIRIKNLGNYRVEDLLVSDFITEDSIVREISKMFYDEKGTWLIKSLKAGEEWEVSYMINRDAKLDTLPNVFGVDKSEVYGTLISSGEVVTVFKEEPQIVEKVGMGLAVGFLVLYLLF